MIVVNSQDDTHFTINGIEYFRNYVNETAGDLVRIYNCFTAFDIRQDWTHYSQYIVDGNTFSSALLLQVALNNVTFNKVTGGGGGGAVNSVNGQTGTVVLDQDDVLDGTNFKQFSSSEKTKLAGIEAGAEVNVNADWNASSGDAQILNKPTIPSIDGLVPYTGATSDVNLGEFGVQLGNLEFDNTPTNVPTGAGSLSWNDSDGTLDLKLKGGNVTLQIGQESVLRVVNKTATNINLLESNYQAVRVTGAQGQRLKVDLAQATSDALSAETIGIITETINNNQEGFITTSGLVRGINTTGSLQSETWADGDTLYLSPTTAGRITKVKPTAPNHLVIIGYVIYAHATQGSIFVKVDNGYELDELHNVKIVTPTNNQYLGYNSSLDVWENKTNTIDSTPTNGSTNAVSSDGVFDGLALKQDALTEVNFGSFSNGLTSKTTPVANDAFVIRNSVNGQSEKVTYTNLSATLKVYFDTIYSGLNNSFKRILNNTIETSLVTGTISETLIYSAPVISGGTFTTNDFFRFQTVFRKQPGNSVGCTYRVYISNTNNFATASLLSTWTSQRFNTVFERNYLYFKADNTINSVIPATTTTQTDVTNTDVSLTSISLNPANDIYFFVSVQLGTGTDNVKMTAIKISN